MLGEHLDTIRSREERARKAIREAGLRAARMVEKAREDGEQRLDEVRSEMAEDRREMISKAGKEAEGRIDELKKENQERISALEKAAGKNRDQALAIVLEAFRC